MIVTEVYVSVDNLNYSKIDLFKEESINMVYVRKDLQDISKVFSPYSLDFTFEATPNNRMALGFFGDTDVIKRNLENKYYCKIYSNGALVQFGFLVLKSLAYKSQVPQYFSANFSTSMLNLKDRIGSDLISGLGELNIAWTPKIIEQLLQSEYNGTVDGVPVRYFVPLISNERVLSYDPSFAAGLKDNIAYNISTATSSENILKPTELRPAMSLSTLIELIKNKYNLFVTAPLDNRSEYKDAFVWCNSETVSSIKETIVDFIKPFGSLSAINTKNEGAVPDPKKYVPTLNLGANSINVKMQMFQSEWDKFITFSLVFNNIIATTSSSNTPSVQVKIKRAGTNEILISGNFEITGTVLTCVFQIPDSAFISNNLDFYMTMSFNQPTVWASMDVNFQFRYYDGRFGSFNQKRYATYVYQSNGNVNSDAMNGSTIDLFQSLPPIKVIDLLTSYLKTFNINIFDTSPSNENLFWLTPDDINTSGLEYSKATIDYTPYLDDSSYKKETSSDFNYYNFKHATSKYRSNVDYLATFGIEYGQTTYPSVVPTLPREFKVETIFTIMPPVMLYGSSEIVTYYGFTADAPTILDTGEKRYKPNFGELTIFYSNGPTNITNSIGYSTSQGGVPKNVKLTRYIKVMPFNIYGKSLAFSELVFNSVSYPDSLYMRYYASQTTRLLNPNVLSQFFKVTLPSDELTLNSESQIQGQGLTPSGFRLQNDIIIKENLFSIIDATIDITTGKTNLTLLNY